MQLLKLKPCCQDCHKASQVRNTLRRNKDAIIKAEAMLPGLPQGVPIRNTLQQQQNKHAITMTKMSKLRTWVRVGSHFESSTFYSNSTMPLTPGEKKLKIYTSYICCYLIISLKTTRNYDVHPPPPPNLTGKSLSDSGMSVKLQSYQPSILSWSVDKNNHARIIRWGWGNQPSILSWYTRKWIRILTRG